MVCRVSELYFALVGVEVTFPRLAMISVTMLNRLNFLRLESSQPVSVMGLGSLGILAPTEGGTRCGAGPAHFFACLLHFQPITQTKYFCLLRFLLSFFRVLYSRRVMQMTGQSPTLGLISSFQRAILESTEAWEESPNTTGQQAG